MIDILTYREDRHNIPIVDGRYFIHLVGAPDEDGRQSAKIFLFPRHASGDALKRYRKLCAQDIENEVVLGLVLELRNKKLAGEDDEGR